MHCHPDWRGSLPYVCRVLVGVSLHHHFTSTYMKYVDDCSPSPISLNSDRVQSFPPSSEEQVNRSSLASGSSVVTCRRTRHGSVGVSDRHHDAHCAQLPVAQVLEQAATARLAYGMAMQQDGGRIRRARVSRHATWSATTRTQRCSIRYRCKTEDDAKGAYC